MPADQDLDAPISFDFMASQLGVEFAIWAMRSAPEHDATWGNFAAKVANGAGIDPLDNCSYGAQAAYKTAKAAVEKVAKNRMENSMPSRRNAIYAYARDDERRRQYAILLSVLEETA